VGVGHGADDALPDQLAQAIERQRDVEVAPDEEGADVEMVDLDVRRGSIGSGLRVVRIQRLRRPGDVRKGAVPLR
jgi:hypothetical protein